MAAYTEYYQLHQWEPEDNFLREDFNEDLKKIDSAIKGVETGAAQALSQYQTANDAAVAALESGTNATLAALAANLGTAGKNARIAWGSYTGDGTYGVNNPSTLTFDFYPVMVFLGNVSNAADGENPTIMMRGHTKIHPDTSLDSSQRMTGLMQLTWTDNGVSWYNESKPIFQCNYSGHVYHYVVIGYDKAAESV